MCIGILRRKMCCCSRRIDSSWQTLVSAHSSSMVRNMAHFATGATASTVLYTGANQKLDTFCGSPPYAAPELFSDDHYIGAPVDVWALGILLYFMVVGNMPFRAPTIPGLKAAILKGDYLLPGQLSLPCIRLIRECRDGRETGESFFLFSYPSCRTHPYTCARPAAHHR